MGFALSCFAVGKNLQWRSKQATCGVWNDKQQANAVVRGGDVLKDSVLLLRRYPLHPKTMRKKDTRNNKPTKGTITMWRLESELAACIRWLWYAMNSSCGSSASSPQSLSVYLADKFNWSRQQSGYASNRYWMLKKEWKMKESGEWTRNGGRTPTCISAACLLHPPANMKKTMKNRLPSTTHKKRDESSRKQTKGNGCLFVYSGLNSPNFCFVARIFLRQSLGTKNQRPQGHNATIDTTEQSTQRNNQHNGTTVLFIFCWGITTSLAGEKTFYTIRFWQVKT